MEIVRNIRGKELRILAYHRVLEVPSHSDFRASLDLVSASCSSFDWQMRYLRRHYDPISFSFLDECLRGEATLPRRPVIVTFDDGFEDNYLNAVPILRKYNVPATFFLATGYVGSSTPFWFDRVACLIQMAKPGRIQLEDIALELEIGSGPVQRRVAEVQLLAYLKSVSDEVRKGTMESLARHLGVELPPEGLSEAKVLNWEQVRDMAQQGMEFGSHTVTHPILTKVGMDTLKRELLESKATIEAQTGRPCLAFAYPVGGEQHFSQFTASQLAVTGYRFGVSYRTGTNLCGQFELFGMRRLHVERDTTRSYFRAMLTFPSRIGGIKDLSGRTFLGKGNVALPLWGEPEISWEKLDAYQQALSTNEPLRIREVGGNVSMDAHLGVLRTLTVDQTFWAPLVPGWGQPGTCLVVDDTWGALTCQLAKEQHMVVSVHPNWRAAAFIQAAVRKAGLDNVLVIHTDLMRDLPIADGSISLAVFIRMGALLAGQYGKHSDVVAKRMLQNAHNKLAENGTVILADQNAHNYQQLSPAQWKSSTKSTWAGLPLERLRGWLAGNFLACQEYVGKLAYSQGLVPPPELSSQAVRTEGEKLKHKKRSRLKEQLLSGDFGSRFWPSFLLIANKVGVEEIPLLQGAEASGEGDWQACADFRVKRIIAGNSDVTVIIAGPEGNAEQDVVIRLPRSEDGERKARHQAKVLQELAHGTFASLVPCYLGSGVWGGNPYFVEQKRQGVELEPERHPRVDAYCHNAVRQLIHAQEATSVRQQFVDADYDRLIGTAVTTLGSYCLPSELSVLNEVDGMLRNRLVGKSIPLVRTHGDFKIGNVLFHPGGEVAAFIDWDLSEQQGLPLVDVYAFCTYRIAQEQHKPVHAAYSECVLPWRVRGLYEEYLRLAMETFGIDEDLAVSLRAAFWLINLRDRLSMAYKTHGDTATRAIGDVLNGIWRLLKLNSEHHKGEAPNNTDSERRTA